MSRFFLLCGIAALSVVAIAVYLGTRNDSPQESVSSPATKNEIAVEKNAHIGSDPGLGHRHPPIIYKLDDVELQRLFDEGGEEAIKEFGGNQIAITGIVSTVRVPTAQQSMDMANKGYEADAMITLGGPRRDTALELLTSSGIIAYSENGTFFGSNPFVPFIEGQKVSIQCDFGSAHKAINGDGYSITLSDCVQLHLPNRPEGIINAKDATQPPSVSYSPEPEYSEEARRNGISGEVIVNLVVTEQGLPADVHVLRGIGHGLDESAMDAVKKYKFHPAMKDGVPVSVRLNVAVNFQLYDGAKPPTALDSQPAHPELH